MRNDIKKVEGLELARFLFALLVVFYHYFYYAPASGEIAAPVGPGWMAFGRFGVEAFFVISGYVILISANGRTALEFVRARFLRLWPAMVICGTLTTAALAVWGHPSYIGWAKALLFFPVAIGGAQADPAYWSLVIEMRFYAAVAIGLFIAGSIRKLDMLCAAWLTLSFLSFAFPSISQIFLFPYSGFFIFGALLYANRFHHSQLSLWLVPPTFILSSVQAWVDFERIDMLDGSRSPMWVGFIVVIFIFIFTSAARFRVPEWASTWCIRLGTLSYPLYLIHQSIGFLLIKSMMCLGLPLAGAITVLIVIAISYGVTFLEPLIRGALIRGLARLALLTRGKAQI